MWLCRWAAAASVSLLSKDEFEKNREIRNWDPIYRNLDPE